MLNKDEWEAQQPPIYWVTLEDYMDHPPFIRDLIIKWCDEYLNGWFYKNYQSFAFGLEKDRTTFLMFYKSKVWSELNGSLLPNK